MLHYFFSKQHLLFVYFLFPLTDPLKDLYDMKILIFMSLTKQLNGCFDLVLVENLHWTFVELLQTI